MAMSSMTVEVVYEHGVLRPLQPLPLTEQQKVTITVQFQANDRPWPADTAEIYKELAEEDRRLASVMFGMVKETWPPGEEQL